MGNTLTHPFFKLPDISLADRKQALVDHLTFLQSMDVYELTLYKKWKRMQEYRTLLNRASVIKANMWQPDNWNHALHPAFDLLQPVIRPVRTDADQRAWDILREFVSSHIFENNPGRFIKFLVTDEGTGKYLGCVALSSDIMELGVRDKWIGWKRDRKLGEHALNHIANAAVLVPVQPFGYNFLGGKLLAALVTAPSVQAVWADRYGDILVGLTTTSLYGPQSQYNGIPFWKGMGETTGQTFLTPDPEYYEEWVEWLKREHNDDWRAATIPENPEAGPVSGSKLRLLAAIYKHLGLNAADHYHGFHRGVYFCSFYQNTREYLRGEIDGSQLNPKTIKGLDWWRPKARARYLKLLVHDQINTQTTFYADLLGLSWEETKRRYLQVVGR